MTMCHSMSVEDTGQLLTVGSLLPLWVLELKVRSPSSGSKHFMSHTILLISRCYMRGEDFWKGRNQGWGRAGGRRNKGEGEKHGDGEESFSQAENA